MGAANTSVLTLCHGGKGQGHHWHQRSPHLPHLAHLRASRYSSNGLASAGGKQCSDSHLHSSVTSVYGEGDSGQGQGQDSVGSSPGKRNKRHSNKSKSKRRTSKQKSTAAPPTSHSGDTLVTATPSDSLKTATLGDVISQLPQFVVTEEHCSADECEVDTATQCQLPPVLYTPSPLPSSPQTQPIDATDLQRDVLSAADKQVTRDAVYHSPAGGTRNKRNKKNEKGVKQQQNGSVNRQQDGSTGTDLSKLSPDGTTRKLTMSSQKESKKKNGKRQQPDVAITVSNLNSGTSALMTRESENKPNTLSLNGFIPTHLAGKVSPDTEPHLAGRAMLFAPDGFQHLSPVQSPADPPNLLIGGGYPDTGQWGSEGEGQTNDVKPHSGSLDRNSDIGGNVKKKRKKVKSKSDKNTENGEKKSKRPTRKRSLKISTPATAVTELYVDTSPTRARPRSLNDSLSPRNSDFKKRYFDTVVEIVKKKVTVEEIFSDSEMHNCSDDDLLSAKRPHNRTGDVLTATATIVLNDAITVSTNNGTDAELLPHQASTASVETAKSSSPRKKSQKKLSPVVKKVLGWKQASVSKTEVREDVIPQASHKSDVPLSGDLYPDDSDCLPGTSEQLMPEQESLAQQTGDSDNRLGSGDHDNSITESLYQSVSSSSNPHTDSIGDDASSLHGFETIGSETSSLGDHVHDVDSAIGQDAGRSPSPDGVFGEESPLSHQQVAPGTGDSEWVTHDVKDVPAESDTSWKPTNVQLSDVDMNALNGKNVLLDERQACDSVTSADQLDNATTEVTLPEASEGVLPQVTWSKDVLPGLAESKLLSEALQSVPVIQQSPLLYAYQPTAQYDDVADASNKALSLVSSNTLQPMALAFITAVTDKVAVGEQDTSISLPQSTQEPPFLIDEAANRDNHQGNKQSAVLPVEDDDSMDKSDSAAQARDAVSSLDDDAELSKTLDDKFDTVSTCSECISYLSADEPSDVFDDAGKSVLTTVDELASDAVTVESETCQLELVRPSPSPASAMQEALEVNQNIAPEQEAAGSWPGIDENSDTSGLHPAHQQHEDDSAKEENTRAMADLPADHNQDFDLVNNDLCAAEVNQNVNDEASVDQCDDVSSNLLSPVECMLDEIACDVNGGASELVPSGVHDAADDGQCEVSSNDKDSQYTDDNQALLGDTGDTDQHTPAEAAFVFDSEIRQLEMALPAAAIAIAAQQSNKPDTDTLQVNDTMQSDLAAGQSQDQILNEEGAVKSNGDVCWTVEVELCHLEVTRPCDSHVGDTKVAEQELDQPDYVSDTTNTEGETELTLHEIADSNRFSNVEAGSDVVSDVQAGADVVTDLEASSDLTEHSHERGNFWTIESEVCQLEVVRQSASDDKDAASNNQPGGVLQSDAAGAGEEQLNAAATEDKDAAEAAKGLADEDAVDDTTQNGPAHDADFTDEHSLDNSGLSAVTDISQQEATPEFDRQEQWKKPTDVSTDIQADNSASGVTDGANNAECSQQNEDVETVGQLEIARPESAPKVDIALKVAEQSIDEQTDATNEDSAEVDSADNVNKTDNAALTFVDRDSQDKFIVAEAAELGAHGDKQQLAIDSSSAQEESDAAADAAYVADVADVDVGNVDADTGDAVDVADVAAAADVDVVNVDADTGAADAVVADTDDVNVADTDASAADVDAADVADVDADANAADAGAADVDADAGAADVDADAGAADADAADVDAADVADADAARICSKGEDKDASNEIPGHISHCNSEDGASGPQDSSTRDNDVQAVDTSAVDSNQNNDTDANSNSNESSDIVPYVSSDKSEMNETSSWLRPGTSDGEAGRSTEAAQQSGNTRDPGLISNADNAKGATEHATSDQPDGTEVGELEAFSTGDDRTREVEVSADESPARLTHSNTVASEASGLQATDGPVDNGETAVCAVLAADADGSLYEDSSELNETSSWLKQRGTPECKASDATVANSADNKPADDKLLVDSSEINESSSWFKAKTSNNNNQSNSSNSNKSNSSNSNQINSSNKHADKPKPAHDDDKPRQDAAEVTQAWREVPYKPDSSSDQASRSRLPRKDTDSLSYVTEASWSFDIEVRTYTFSTLSADEYRRNREREQRELATQRMQLERRSRFRFGYRGLLSEFRPQLFTDCFESVVSSK